MTVCLLLSRNADRASRRVALLMLPKTVGTLALLTAVLPLNAAATAAAMLTSAMVPKRRRRAAQPKTVLISGGKMTKSLQLARAFHAAGHRVIMVETWEYRFTGHRFSRAVDRFHTIPEPQSPNYAAALLAIVRAEGVDVYVPVSSPAASLFDAAAEPTLAPYCDVLHCDADTVAALDNKYRFTALAASLGLSVPETHLITDPGQVEQFDFSRSAQPFILKSIAYDPVNRLDLTRLPLASEQQTAAFARAKPIGERSPWILQAYVSGREFCTHSTVRDGRTLAYCCSTSSAFQVNYEMVDKPAIEAWVTHFVESLGLTGQISFDFIEDDDGIVYAIECNPRAHTAITMFHDHPDLAAAYLDPAASEVRPLSGSRPTYWIYHELWRLLTSPLDAAARLRVIARGKDAIFDRCDPLPFLLAHHLHIPWLLVRSLLQGKDWVRIDFNIGKLVSLDGD